MPMNNPAMPDAPIPGANYTSNEKNYPWHRPPDITDTDEAIDYVADKFNDGTDGIKYMEMIRAGVTVAAVTDMIVTIGISDGKWTPDFAILIAGPVARLVTILAKGYNIDYEMGLDTEGPFVTSEFLKAIEGSDQIVEINELDVQEVKDSAPQEQAGGLMSMSSTEEQNAMLGYGDEEPEADMMNEESA
jgi:hypothetical protein